MMRLLLLRHAKSSWSDAELADHERPLNRRGRTAATAMGAYLLAEGLLPDLALVSSARRTQESWQRLDAEWPVAPPAKTLRGLYLAPASQILAQIRRAPVSVQTLLVLGHNPGLENLARSLIGPDSEPGAEAELRAKYPTGALALFDCAIEDWEQLRASEAKLLRFVTPRALTGEAGD